MELSDLLRHARAEGVTMIILDGKKAGCWHRKHKRYFSAYDADPAVALTTALERATDPNYDPEILV